jgi:hypothetical protein
MNFFSNWCLKSINQCPKRLKKLYLFFPSQFENHILMSMQLKWESAKSGKDQ